MVCVKRAFTLSGVNYIEHEWRLWCLTLKNAICVDFFHILYSVSLPFAPIIKRTTELCRYFLIFALKRMEYGSAQMPGEKRRVIEMSWKKYGKRVTKFQFAPLILRSASHKAVIGCDKNCKNRQIVGTKCSFRHFAGGVNGLQCVRYK